MKGVRFYADYNDAKTKRKGGRAPNALALLTGDEYRNSNDQQECIASVFCHADSDLALTGVSWQYLRTACKRISEAEAMSYPAMKRRMADERS